MKSSGKHENLRFLQFFNYWHKIDIEIIADLPIHDVPGWYEDALPKEKKHLSLHLMFPPAI